MPGYSAHGYGSSPQASTCVDGMTREEIVQEFTPRISAMARRLMSRIPADAAVELDDLFNSGAVGLLDAMARYDAGRHVQFSTFADYRIRGAMLDVLRRLDPATRPARAVANRLQAAVAELEQHLSRAPEPEEVADHLGIGIDEYWDLVNEGRSVLLVSFEARRGEKNRPHADILENPRAASVEEQVAMKEALQAMRDAIEEHLTERQRTVLIFYYMKDMTLREIGEVLGITESRVSQIHSEACLRLRPHMKGHYSPRGGEARGRPARGKPPRGRSTRERPPDGSGKGRR